MVNVASIHYQLQINRLKQLRESHGLSQRQLSRLCGFADVMINRYESGETEPSAQALGKIASALGVSVDYLLGMTDQPLGAPAAPRELDAAERELIETFRREGYIGVIRYSASKLP